MAKLIKAWVILLLLLGAPAAAQQPDIVFERLPLDQGLSENYVDCITQDRQGFLWFGTQGGLNRFDGYSFTSFLHNPDDNNSLPNNAVSAIEFDNNGIMWVGTGDGLAKFDPLQQRFTNYRHDAKATGSLSNSSISALYLDRAGTLWIGTKGGLNSLDRDSARFTAYRHAADAAAGLSHDIITSIAEDGNGTLWIGTIAGLNSFDRASGRFTSYRHEEQNPHSISDNRVKKLFVDRRGQLWIGTENGLNRFDAAARSFIRYRFDAGSPAGSAANHIMGMAEDAEGFLWIGTAGAGLQRLSAETGDYTVYRAQPGNLRSPISDSIATFYLDRAGTLWMGSPGAGLQKYNPAGWRFITYRREPHQSQSLSSNIVRGFYQDASGILWIGTQEGGGLNRFDPATGQFTAFQHDPANPHSISSNDVRAIRRDKRGRLWLTTSTCLNRYDETRRRFIAYCHDADNPTSISSNNVSPLHIDGSGTLWIGSTDGGLNRYIPEIDGFRAYRHDATNPDSIWSDNILVIYEDRAGLLWLSGNPGLCRFDPRSEKFTRITSGPDNANIINGEVRAICEGRNGILWLGTVNLGFYRYDPRSGSLTQFTVNDGLPDNNVVGILEDNDGNLWLSTFKGLSRFEPGTKKFKNYDVRDGLQSNEYNTGASLKGRNGELYFGGINGFNIIYPERLKENGYIPPIVITAFNIFDKPADAARRAIAQQAGGAAAQALELGYQENFFSFEFAALNYTNTEKNQYAYKLVGFDKDWIYAGTRRYASYTNLDPGEYTLLVKGSNNDGVWNETGVALKIRIIPPLWRTWWAYSLYLLSLMTIAYGGLRYRINAVERANRLKTAAEIEKKNRELEKKNAELLESHKRADRIFSALAEALPGTVLDGKYRLDEKIGAGGFGAVFRATHLGLQRPIAVKVFRPVAGNDSAEALERFKLEAVNACRINHPNAVTVLDSGISAEGIAYLVMELLEGHALSRELQANRTLSALRAAQIIVPVCDVLAKAHAAGIVHRDIKPENIFLHRGPQGEVVKVVDFGIAKLLGEETGSDKSDLTGTGKLIGTPAYMAPERLAHRPYDGKADVYSVGVMLYEMVCGQPPFHAPQGQWQTALMHLMLEPVPPRQINAALPVEVESVIMQALAKDAAARPDKYPCIRKKV